MCNRIRTFYGGAQGNCPNCLEETETHCISCIYYEESEDLDEIGICQWEGQVRATKAFFTDCPNWHCIDCQNWFDRLEENENE